MLVKLLSLEQRQQDKMGLTALMLAVTECPILIQFLTNEVGMQTVLSEQYHDIKGLSRTQVL